MRSVTRLLAILVRVAWIASWIGLGLVLFIGLVSWVAPVLGLEARSVVSRLSFQNPEEMLIWTLGGTVFLLGAIFILSLVHGILATLIEGDPFVPANAGRLRMICVCLALLEVGRMGLAVLTGGDAGLNFMVWAAVAIIIVLAQIFAEGAALREDRKLTI